MLRPQGCQRAIRAGAPMRRRPHRERPTAATGDRKSTRLNSSHLGTSYAVFCLEKKSTCVFWLGWRGGVGQGLALARIVSAVAMCATQAYRRAAASPTIVAGAFAPGEDDVRMCA